jgi:hypothetical protein
MREVDYGTFLGEGEDYVHEAGFDVEEEKPWDWGHDGCHP